MLGPSYGLVKKRKKYLMKKGALRDFTQKYKFSWIFRKSSFLESVSFHSQILVATTFGLVLGDCIVIAIIFITKYVVKLSRITFYELLKIPIIIIWAMLEKVCLVFTELALGPLRSSSRNVRTYVCTSLI